MTLRLPSPRAGRPTAGPARRLLRALPVALPLLAAAPALGQLATPTPTGSSTRTVVVAPLQDLQPAGTFGERAERLWIDVLDFFGFGSGPNYFMRSYATVQRGRGQSEDFTWLMDIAGYKLKEIESSVSLIPHISLTFAMARELTEADREYVERMLDRHARSHGGPMAAIQRTIVRGILDASELGTFAVEKVEVDLFPLPKVKFILAPIDAPLGLEASRIMRAIDRLNARVQSMSARPQGFDLPPPPSAGPRPASLDN